MPAAGGCQAWRTSCVQEVPPAGRDLRVFQVSLGIRDLLAGHSVSGPMRVGTRNVLWQRLQVLVVAARAVRLRL